MRLSAVQDAYWPNRDGAAVPPIVVWLALSVMVHIAAMLWSPRLRNAPPEYAGSTPLTVLLRSLPPPDVAPPPAPEPAPRAAVTPPPPAPRQRTEPPRRAAKPQPPPVVAATKPAPEAPPVPAPPPKVEEPPAPTPAPAPAPAAKAAPAPESDLTAYIEARRRARGESPADAPAPDTDRANRGPINSAGLKQAVPTTFNTQQRRNGYGSFEIRRRGVDYAEFLFKGWNENFRRDASELIEVRQGTHSSIDLAVIRSIIEIIRRTETGDFTWQSHRLGRVLVLSARPRDNAMLEEILMQEFYDDLHRYR